MLGVREAGVAAALLVLATARAAAAAADYCGAAMCGNTNAHTFCQYPEGPGPRCSGYIDDRLSGEEKARVLLRMNRRRSEAARGSTQLPPASNMLELRWVEELAREAQLWADQCLPPGSPEQHDACRDLYSITVGQCVASVVGEAPGLRPESMVDMWYLQGRQHPGIISMYAMNNKQSVLDFAQMLWAQTYLVGCARSRFMTELEGRLRTVTRLVCNFAPRGPAAESALWLPGAPAAACPRRARPAPDAPDAAPPGLCAFHPEPSITYDVTNATVLKEQLVLDTILEIERNDSLNYRGSLDQIYMTKMMAASMVNQTAQQTIHDSTNKEAPAEPTTLEDKDVSANITDNNNKNIIDDVIEKMIRDIPTTRKTKKPLNIVGRPKSYNMEDLNIDHRNPKNGTARPVDTLEQDDAYRNYELDDFKDTSDQDYTESVTESNSTTVSAPNAALAKNVKNDEFEAMEQIIDQAITITENATETSTYITTRSDSVNSIGSESSNALHTNFEGEFITPYVQNDILKRLLDLSQKTDQNPSDRPATEPFAPRASEDVRIEEVTVPQTARQLEEALESMERALAAPVSNKKVRRELRSHLEEPRNEQPNQTSQPSQLSPRKEVPVEQSQSQKFRDIGTPDSAPVLAILRRYAPLIKGYDIFSRSAASTTSLSLVLLLGCMCIVSATLQS